VNVFLIGMVLCVHAGMALPPTNIQIQSTSFTIAAGQDARFSSVATIQILSLGECSKPSMASASGAPGNPFAGSAAPKGAVAHTPAPASDKPAPGNPFGPPDSSPSVAPRSSTEAAPQKPRDGPGPVPGNPFASSVRGSGASDTKSGAPAPTKSAESKPAPIVRVGLLAKKGGIPGLFGFTWKNRYVNVSNGKLTYHESLAEAKGRLHPVKDNELALSDFIVTIDDSDSSRATFKLRPLEASGRVWEFDCSDKSERKAWIEALESNGAELAKWGD